jgi:putative MATE family efflux protein
MRFRLPSPPLRHPKDTEILRLAVPAFGALIAEPLFLLADSAIVGRLGTAELAGLGIAATVLQSGLSLCVFLAYGTTAAVARRLGAGDPAGALRLGFDGLWLAGLIGVVLAVAGFLTAEVVVGWFGAAPDAGEHAVTYLRVSMAGLPAMLGVFAMTGLLRGLQDTKTPLYVAVAANLINIVLNYALVYGLDMGIAGSALGTVLAQWASLLVYVATVQSALRAEDVPLGPSGAGVGRSFRASAPLFVRNLSMRAVIVVSAAVAASFGSAELAAHQVAFAMYTALALGLDAVAIAGQAMVGRYLGAGDRTGARSATDRMVELSVMFGVALGVVLLLGRDLIAPLFSSDEEVQSALSSVLLVLAIFQPAAGWVFALDGVLIGAGDARFLAAGATVATLAFLPAAVLVMAANLGLEALWLCIGAWVLVRLALLIWRVHGEEWAVAGASRS